MQKLHYFIVLCLYTGISSFSQQPYSVTTITTANGLPSNYIFDVKEDAQGYIWAATDKGLCRYNGNSWKVWDTDNGLPGNYVNQIEPATDGGLWIGNSEKGVFYFDIIKNKFYSLRAGSKNEIGSFFKVGNLVYNYGKAKGADYKYYQLLFDKKNATASRIQLSAAEIFSSSQLKTIYLPGILFQNLFDEKLLLTADKIHEHNANAQPLQLTNVFKNRTHLASLRKFKSQYYLTNLGEGLAVIDSATTRVTYYNKENGLPTSQINNVLVKSNGEIYLSSFGSGIIIIKNKTDKTLMWNEKPVYQISKANNSLYYLNDEKLFVQQGNSTQQIALAEPPLAFLVSGDTLYTGSFKGLHVHKFNGTKATLLKTYTLTAGISSIFFNNGLLTASSYGRGFNSVGNDGNWIINNNPPFNNIEKIIVLSNGNLAALSYESGITILDKHYVLQKHFTSKDGLPSNEVRDIVWNNDTIWAACKNGIAVIYQNKIIKTYSAANGLKGKTVRNIFFYKKNLLAVTNSHVHFLSGNKFVPIKSFIAQNNELKNITTASLINGNMYVATPDGIIVIPAEELLKTNKPATPSFIYVIQKGEILNTSTINLPYDYTFIDFYFGSLSTDITTKTRLYYSIDSTEWLPGTDSNSIRLTKLTSGHYRIYVKSINENGTESESILAITCMVTKPWFLQWWFFIAAAALLSFLVFKITQHLNKRKYKKQLQLQQQLETERQRISRDLHDNMGAYTSALIANVQQQKAEHGETVHTQKMQANAESILNSLRETIWVLNNKEITLEEFNDGFKNYCFKVLRNFEHIDFNAIENIDQNPLLKASLAIHLNKIMQEAIQNCIKHSAATAIQYSISDADGLEIIITDNGKGFDAQDHTKGFGLENMQWRAKEAGIQLTINTSPAQGTAIQINTPK